MYQNESENLPKIWYFGSNFSSVANSKHKEVLLTQTMHEVMFSLRISLVNVKQMWTKQELLS